MELDNTFRHYAKIAHFNHVDHKGDRDDKHVFISSAHIQIAKPKSVIN